MIFWTSILLIRREILVGEDVVESVVCQIELGGQFGAVNFGEYQFEVRITADFRVPRWYVSGPAGR